MVCLTAGSALEKGGTMIIKTEELTPKMAGMLAFLWA